MRKKWKLIKGYVIHDSDATQGCKRCIDYTDGTTFRAQLNNGACECQPFEADEATALDRGAGAITDTVFDMSASLNTACKCNTGKFTSVSSGSLMCLECAAAAGFLAPPNDASLTDCLSAATQCEARGFSSVVEDDTDGDGDGLADNPSVRCGCDTSKNFFDNVGGKVDVEGCYCYKGDNWWTLVNGEYIETDGYVADINYDDLSDGFL